MTARTVLVGLAAGSSAAILGTGVGVGFVATARTCCPSINESGGKPPQILPAETNVPCFEGIPRVERGPGGFRD